jgi:DNA polymerase III epsilon subunit-like protein
MYLVFDVETNGLPKNYRASVENSDNWPRIVQLAWALYSKEHNLVNSQSYIVKGDFEISSDLVKIHGISKEISNQYGEDISRVLRYFRQSCSQAEYFVGHNLSFDKHMVQSELFRLNILDFFPEEKEKQICTMWKSNKFCNLRNGNRLKWPKLEELHEKLFNNKFINSHNALFDVMATAKCFFELKRLEIIEL